MAQLPLKQPRWTRAQPTRSHAPGSRTVTIDQGESNPGSQTRGLWNSCSRAQARLPWLLGRLQGSLRGEALQAGAVGTTQPHAPHPAVHLPTCLASRGLLPARGTALSSREVRRTRNMVCGQRRPQVLRVAGIQAGARGGHAGVAGRRLQGPGLLPPVTTLAHGEGATSNRAHSPKQPAWGTNPTAQLRDSEQSPTLSEPRLHPRDPPRGRSRRSEARKPRVQGPEAAVPVRPQPHPTASRRAPPSPPARLTRRG